MISIVVVSHSAKLAESVCELAQQVAQGSVKMAFAGGVDDDECPFGTDAIKILKAIESVYTDEGVLVMADIGSSIMSAETALEFIGDDKRDNIRLCEAPLIEGTIVAAALVAAGASFDQIEQEACSACDVKIQHFGRKKSSQEIKVAVSSSSTGSWEKIITVSNPMGLHARPAAQCVMAASRFNSSLLMYNLDNEDEAANVLSINQIARLGVRQGHRVRLVAHGDDAKDAVTFLENLFRSNFGEPLKGDDFPTSIVPKAEGKDILTGIPISPGIIEGEAYVFKKQHPNVQEYHIDNSVVEWNRLELALEQAKHKIHRLCRDARYNLNTYDLAIFDVHLLCLKDPELLGFARKFIFDEKINAEAAWQRSIDQHLEAYNLIPDVYKQTCAADVVDVKVAVLQMLLGEQNVTLSVEEPCILLAKDLDPSDVIQLNPEKIKGLCLSEGNVTSHAVILARALGIPTIINSGSKLLEVQDNSFIVMDGATGQIWINPQKKVLARLRKKSCTNKASRKRGSYDPNKPFQTKDASVVRVVANICDMASAHKALKYGVDGVGLLRSEFLFWNYTSDPSEEEQYKVYRDIFNVMSGMSCVVRTLDIGGDKFLPYYNLTEENNAFMGQRGIRFSLAFPSIFKTQLRALLRAGVEHSLKIMFPMVSSLEELRMAKQIIAEVQEELSYEGKSFNNAVEIGVMIEVPAATIIADKMAQEADFFSIGSNDLVQYLTATDRSNTEVASLGHPFHLAHLRAIKHVTEVAHQAGITVSICGELASDPIILPLLLGLGIDEFSVDPVQIPIVREALSYFTKRQALSWTKKALSMDSGDEIKKFLNDKYTKVVKAHLKSDLN